MFRDMSVHDEGWQSCVNEHSCLLKVLAWDHAERSVDKILLAHWLATVRYAG